MVDLQDDRSLVKNLLAQGEDVYLIDWGYPDRSDRFLTLEDYIERFIGGAVDHSCAAPRTRCDQRARHLPGRRVLAVLLRAASGPDQEPHHHGHAGGFPHAGQHAVALDPPSRYRSVRRHAGQRAGRPDELCYLTLKPFRLNVQKYVGMVDILDDKKAIEDFLRMEKWIFDSPDQAGEAFRQFIKQFYQAMVSSTGGIDIGGREVDLASSTCRC
jgi:polyhydroxyalkanoate synthase